MGEIMRYGVSALLTALCFAVGSAHAPAASGATRTDKSGGMVMKLKGKDGKSFEIHVPAPNGKPQSVPGLDDLFGVFMDYCLEAFPNDAAVEAKAKAGAHQVLEGEDLNTVLHGDPGQGWVVRLNHSAITVTVEDPPYHSCGVQAILPTEPDIGMKAATFIGLWGLTQMPAETLVPQPLQTRSAGGGTQTLHPFVFLGPDKKPVEQIGAYIGHEPSSQQVKLRLVRMRGSNPN
jgi:hypothetical protein